MRMDLIVENYKGLITLHWVHTLKSTDSIANSQGYISSFGRLIF